MGQMILDGFWTSSAAYLIEVSIVILVLFYYKITKRPPPKWVENFITRILKVLNIKYDKRELVTWKSKI